MSDVYICEGITELFTDTLGALKIHGNTGMEAI